MCVCWRYAVSSILFGWPQLQQPEIQHYVMSFTVLLISFIITYGDLYLVH